jgi:hypothetical protein
MQAEFIARTSMWRLLLLILGSMAFVIGGAWIAGLFGTSPSDRIWVGWMSMVFFGACAAVGFVRLLNPGDDIVVNAFGIRWRSWGDQPIPWSAIDRIEERSVRRQRFLSLYLNDPERHPPPRGLGLQAFNRRMGFGDISITTAGTTKSHKQLMEAIERFRPVGTRSA